MKYVDVKCQNKRCRNIMKLHLPCNSVSELIKILFRPKALRFGKTIREVETKGYLVCVVCHALYNRDHLPDFYIISSNNEPYHPPIRV